MSLFLTISRGDRADKAKPVLATGDQRIIRRVLDELARLDEEEPPQEERQPEPTVGVQGFKPNCR